VGVKIEDRVPNAPLREAFERMDLSLPELACRLGWERQAHRSRTKVGDTSRVRRALGYAPSAGTRSYNQEFIKYDTAVQIVRAMGLDPVDYGI
jgi:hypothetical protein